MSEKGKTPNPVDVHVGERVKIKRKMLGMSQEKLGESLGVTFQQVQKYEKGTNRISASRMQQICEVLQESVTYFFDGAAGLGDKASEGFAEDGYQEYSIDFLSSPEGIQLNRSFAKIKDPKVRKKIVDLVKSLADEAD